jgi:Putative prokaryotic signal transducing protein
MQAAVLTVVADEMEAEALCGLLRANGIRCTYRKTNVAAAASADGGRSIFGPTEVLVADDDLAAARNLLAAE